MKIKQGAQQVQISLSDLNSSFSIKEWIKTSLKEEPTYSNHEIKNALDVIIDSESFREKPEHVRKQFYRAIEELKRKLSLTKD